MKTRDELDYGRESYGRRAWGDACRSLSLADRATGLGAEDLERLAISAYMAGRDDDYLSVLDRAHHAYLDAGEDLRASRCAFWLGLHFLLREQAGRATGWFARAQRLLERAERDCVEQGYLLLPAAERHLAAGDHEMAYAAAARAAAIGQRFREPDLVACARHVQGRALIMRRHVEQGLALLDEAMVAVTAGELSPMMTGLIYCSVIDACRQMYALDRAREWTAALAQWCSEQPQLIAFTGVCRVHRAEIMQLQGAWHEAIDEARRACERCRGINQRAAAAAFYLEAEVHRLCGDFAAADEGYGKASQSGLEPQPGLALLRLAQGRVDAADAAIRRVVSTTRESLQRTRLLPAYIEIMLARGEIREAAGACRELEEIAERFDTVVLRAMAAQARGAVELAEGNAQAALGSLRRVGQVWQQIEAPYLAARVRVLVGLACRALGDEDGATLEMEAARAIFRRLGAAPDLARIELPAETVADRHSRKLTPRELQVLRLVSAGKTNKVIAAELSLSEKTVDRHLSNILTKLDVPSRAAATAYAYRHKLV
jgi:DNA-binding NarL/FixJ family response regulator